MGTYRNKQEIFGKERRTSELYILQHMLQRCMSSVEKGGTKAWLGKFKKREDPILDLEEDPTGTEGTTQRSKKALFEGGDDNEAREGDVCPLKPPKKTIRR